MGPPLSRTAMRVNIYPKGGGAPLRLRKWVRDATDAQRFCDWWKRTFNRDVYYVICP